MRCFPTVFAVCALIAGWSSLALCAPVELHVLGTPRLIVDAEHEGEVHRVHGRLADEGDQPLGGTLELSTPGGEGLRTRPCGADSKVDGEPIAIPTDGKFCVEVLAHHGLVRAVAKSDNFLDATVDVMAHNQRRIPAPRFTHAPQVIDLGDGSPAVVEVLASSGQVNSPVELNLSLLCGGTPHPLGSRSIAGSRMERFELDIRGEVAPGQCQLVAEASATRLSPSSDSRNVLVRAQVSLETATFENSESSVRVDVLVRRGEHPINSGVLEVRDDGAFVISAPVKEGAAHLDLEREFQSRELSVAYVSSDPALIPEAPLTIEISARSSGFHWAGIHTAFLISFALWLGYAWLRPRDARVQSQISPPPKEARVRSSGSSKGAIRGRVLDAHTNLPLSNAVVSLSRVEVDSTTLLEEQSCDDSGCFSFKTEMGSHPLLRFEARADEEMTLTADVRSAELTIHLSNRRRAALAQLVTWARRQGRPWYRAAAPTPGDVGQIAQREEKPAVANWAEAVAVAAYAPQIPEERAVRDLETPSKQAK